MDGLCHEVGGDHFGLEVGGDYLQPAGDEVAHVFVGGEGVVFLPDLLIMVNYYVAHLFGIVGGVVCYTGAQVCYPFPGGRECCARTGNGVVLVMFSGDVVVVSMNLNGVSIGDGGSVINEGIKPELKGGGVNGPIGVLNHQWIKGGVLSEGEQKGGVCQCCRPW